MKRTLALIAATALLATPVAADAAAKKPAPKPTKRVVTWNYTGVFGAYASVAGGGGVCGANPKACFELPTQKHETKVSFAAVDATGQKIPLQFALDGDYANNQLTCSSGSTPVKKGSTVNFYMVAGPDCPGIPTSGKVTMTIIGVK